jgi:hypothetical protein
MCCLQKAGVVELQIGYHLLEGKIITLKKPLAVLEKECSPVLLDHLDASEHESSDQDGPKTSVVGYKVCHAVN